MPLAILERIRKQDAVYWSVRKNASGQIIVDNNGLPTFNAGVDMKVRWQDTTEAFTDPNGAQRNSKAIVFGGSLPGDTDFDWRGFLWLGTVATLPSGTSTTPRKVFRAAEIMRADKIPNINATRFVRKAFL